MLYIMQRFSIHSQHMVQNQAFATRPAASIGQIGGSGDKGDSPNFSTIALHAAEDMQLCEAIAGLRRRLDNGQVPESARDEIAELLDTTEVSGLDPASRAETLAALQRLTATYDRMAQREAEYHTWHAENEAERAEAVAELQAARTVLAEIEAEARQEAAVYRAAKAERRTAEVARAETERLARLDSIHQEAVAAHEREERERAERDNAAKENLRREAERRAAEKAERKRQQLAAWPRRGALAEGMA
jgi:hypothetical protein